MSQASKARQLRIKAQVAANASGVKRVVGAHHSGTPLQDEQALVCEQARFGCFSPSELVFNSLENESGGACVVPAPSVGLLTTSL